MQNNRISKGQSISPFFGVFMFLAAAICILSSPSITSVGAYDGLKLCGTVVIPSLFPFTVASIFFLKSGALEWIGKFFERPASKILGISGTEFAAVIISLLGGYPVGAKIIDGMYYDNLITRKKAERLIRFSVNASPAFFVSVIGEKLFGNTLVGVIFLISNLISCLALTAVTGKLSQKLNKIQKSQKPKSLLCLSDAFVMSVAEAATVMINICAFTILFSSLSAFIKNNISSGKLYTVISAGLEVTLGCIELKSGNAPLSIFGFVLAFGGLSTICQVKQSASNINPPFYKIIFCRIIHGTVSATISFVLFKIFPIALETISNSSAVPKAIFELNMPSIMLIIFALVFLLYLKGGKDTVNYA